MLTKINISDILPRKRQSKLQVITDEIMSTFHLEGDKSHWQHKFDKYDLDHIYEVFRIVCKSSARKKGGLFIYLIDKQCRKKT